MSIAADAIAHYHELLTRFDPAEWSQAHAAEIRRHYADAPIEAHVLRPYMIDEATYAQTCAALGDVMRAFTIATDRLAADEALRRELGLPDYLEPLLEIDRAHGKPTTLGRLDAIAGARGLSLIEFNAEPKTAPFQYEVERAFDRLPITEAFTHTFHVRRVDLYDRLYDALEARDARCIAVIDKAVWRTPRRASVLRPLMYSAARGCTVLHVDPEEVEYRNGALTASGIAIDMVAFVDWELLINARKRLVKILRAISDGAVGVFSGLSRGLLASYKVVFELLSSSAHAALFPSEIRDAVARYVPWTRVLRERTTDRDGASVDLLPFVAAHRAELVIKPSGGGGGANITIGRDVTDEAWTASIKRGVEQHWIVQQHAVPERQTFPVAQAGGVAMHELSCELSPYVWNGEHADGILCRVVAGSVISDSGEQPIGIANGIETATWIVDRC